MAIPRPQPDSTALKASLEREGHLTLILKVIPRSRQSQVTELLPDGALKVKVCAIPEDGKANEEVRTVLAAWLNLPRRNIEIIQGQTSSQKRVRIVRKVV